jgi:two-component system sensor histidine kinase VanS
MILLNIPNTSKQYGEWDIKLKNDFGKLKKKIFIWIILSAFIALVFGWVIMNIIVDGIFQDLFANTFVYISENILHFSNVEAINLYQKLFRNYKGFWMTVGFVIILLLIFYRALSHFTIYFNEVSKGIDKLLEESEGEITLSPEMDFMEKKLNMVKNTLEKRTKAAQEAEQRKNDLVVYLAHDIKTPLTSVVGYLSLLEEAPDMPMEQRAKYTKITLEKAYRLEQLINEFFEITRFNLQTIVLEKEEINITYMLMQMADEFYPMLVPDNKRTVVDGEENLTVYGDTDKLARVFNNIFKNAIAYSFDDSTIEISAKMHNNNIVITFINQGKAIPQQKLNSIFEKFYRLDSSRSSNTGGAGLGLAIAKEIVTAHGGTITAESSNSHTMFTVTLPEH